MRMIKKDIVTKEEFVKYANPLMIGHLLRELPKKTGRKDMVRKAYHIINNHMKELL